MIADRLVSITQGTEDISRQLTEGLQTVTKKAIESKMTNMKRIQANDPVAIHDMGLKYYIEGDYGGAFKYFAKAAELGEAEAHYVLSVMYREGKGVEEDEKKKLHHLEEAAIVGHPDARYNLASYEWNNFKFKRAMKHWIIAAKLGCDESMKTMKRGYAMGEVSEEDFATALRAYQAAVDTVKSPQREAAEVVHTKV